MEVSLYSEMGTRYFTTYMTDKLEDLFSKCKKIYEMSGNKITIDIKYCKFNPKNHILLHKYCDVIDFIDSHDPIICSILEHNSKVKENQEKEAKGEVEIESIPYEFEPSTIIEYVKNPDYNKVYRLKSYNEMNGRSPDVSILISMAISYLHPRVPMDISNQATTYFTMFRKFWNYTGCVNRESYNMLWGNGVVKVDAVGTNKRGEYLFNIPGTGTITEKQLNQSFRVIPYEFGSSENLSEDIELCNIFDNVTYALQNILTARKSKKKLLSELKIIGE